jgi:hypothetical protein
MKAKKQKEKLEVRIKDYEFSMKNPRGSKWIPEGYHKPGSNKK